MVKYKPIRETVTTGAFPSGVPQVALGSGSKPSDAYIVRSPRYGKLKKKKYTDE